ncbi:MAG: hypothetical protein WBA88_26915 [Pseudaminobacter sp.]
MRWFFLILAINLALVGILVLLDRKYGVDYWHLVRDPNAIAGQPAYYGFYSNLGILLWAAAASTALFAASCLRRSGSADRRIRPLFLGGLFCAVACLDDFFMVHEHSYLIGIPEIVTMAGYAAFLLAFVAAVLPIAHFTKWILLAASLACLALSTLVDMADLTISGAVLIEEAFKFFGIAFLAAYLVSLSFSALASGLAHHNLR